jgi:hypothetical protein
LHSLRTSSQQLKVNIFPWGGNNLDMLQSLPTGVVAVPPLGDGLRCNCTKGGVTGGACNDPAVVQTWPGVLFCGACARLDQRGSQALKVAQDRVAAFSAAANPGGRTWGSSGGPSNALTVSGEGVDRIRSTAFSSGISYLFASLCTRLV